MSWLRNPLAVSTAPTVQEPPGTPTSVPAMIGTATRSGSLVVAEADGAQVRTAPTTVARDTATARVRTSVGRAWLVTGQPSVRVPLTRPITDRVSGSASRACQCSVVVPRGRSGNAAVKR